MDTKFRSENHGTAVAILRASELSWQPTMSALYGQRKPGTAPVNSM